MNVIAEWIPTIFRKKQGFISVGLDTLTFLTTNQLRVYTVGSGFSSQLFKTKTPNVSRKIVLDGLELDIFRLLDFTPSVYARLIDDLDLFVKNLASLVETKIKDRKIVLWYSGGKDSSIALVILLKLRDYIPFDLKVYYIHVPYLDGERNISFVEKIEDRLSIEINYESIQRSKMLDLLTHFGLPFRGRRWCTYHAKVRIMRAIKRKENADYEVTSERMFESLKRYHSLRDYLKKRTFLSGRQFKPIYYIPLPDIIAILKRYGIVHPDYLAGCSRVSCSICPYRTLLELEVTRNDLEDPGLIGTIIEQQYKAYYRKIPKDDYERYSLWRFSPKQAEVILKLKKLESPEKIDNSELRQILSFPWRNNRDKVSMISLEALRELILKNNKNYGIINLQEYAIYF